MAHRLDVHQADQRPLVLHVVFRFDTGGLENGVVNLINGMPEDGYRHAVLSLTSVSSFRERVQRKDTQFVALNKAPGHGVYQYPAVWRVLRSLKPAVVHTRNLGPLEMQLVAAAAGGAARIHGEHGRDVGDLDGSNKRLQRVRRLYSPFVHRYVALSQDLQQYLVKQVGIAPARVDQIYNGVDARRFRPVLAPGEPRASGNPFGQQHWIIGTVGRMQQVKNPSLLAQAFIRALVLNPSLKDRWRLVMVGDGPLRPEVQTQLTQAGLGDLAWLPGDRRDIPELMRAMHCFVLPSLAEGVSNTILEAMATGLPVIATRVGGNAELVQDGRTGALVASGDVDAMAHALLQRYNHSAQTLAMGAGGRREVEQRFSLEAMVMAYKNLYDREVERVLARAGGNSRRH